MISLRAYLKGETDWRDAGWNRRLLSYLAPKATESVQPTNGAHSAPEGQLDPITPSAGHPRSDTIPPLAPEIARGAREAPAAKPAEAQNGAAKSNGTAWAHRRVAKSRFGAIHDRLDQIEDGLEGLTERFDREQAQGQRRSQRAERLLDRAADATERHTTLLHSILVVLERVERRLGPAHAAPTPRLESLAPRPSYFRPSMVAARRSDHDSALDSDPGVPSRAEPTYRGDGPSVSGTLSEISLPTLLSMFELEQRTGRLGLTQQGKPRVSFDFLDGVVVGSRIDEDDADAVATLQHALDWREGHFTFCQGTVLAGTARTRTVGSLLLEATRRNDEAVR